MNTKFSFKTIGVVCRPGSDPVLETLTQLMNYSAERNLTLVLDEASDPSMQQQGLQVASRTVMGDICDLVIVIGGDGCLLGAARDFSPFKVPLLGVNRGRLGFLTDISPAQMELRLDEVLKGEYILEERFLLQAALDKDASVEAENSALNDVVVHSGNSVKMLEFELWVDDKFVYRQRSDGLIVSTPTGSTAYALSGGGPIMHPSLDAIVLVPMFPHTLSSRPIVVGGNSEIQVRLLETNDFSPHMSCDGQGDTSLNPGDTIYIRKRPHVLKLLHPTQHDFYESCRSKLGWSEVL